MLVTLIFLIIAGSLINLTGSAVDKTQTGTLGEIRMIGERIAETVNTVYLNGNGYSINMTLPNTTDHKTNYMANVTTINNTAYVKMQYGPNYINIKLIPINVQSVNMNNGMKYNVTNENGIIKIKNITT
ncbi:MAG: hypothetical protein ACXVHP_01670 [Methanobacterium sp.]